MFLLRSLIFILIAVNIIAASDNLDKFLGSWELFKSDDNFSDYLSERGFIF